MNVTPNCAAYIRTWAYGSVTSYVFNVLDVHEGAITVQNEPPTQVPTELSQWKSLLATASEALVNELVANHGMIVYRITQSSKQTLWVPPGHIIADFVSKEEPLSYGVRKSVYPQFSTCVLFVKSAVDLIKRGGADTKKQEQMIEDKTGGEQAAAGASVAAGGTESTLRDHFLVLLIQVP